MKNIRDHYFKKAKKEGHTARSYYKLEEINDKYKILSPQDIVLDLGCYPGSWIEYTTSKIGKQGKILGIDLKEIESEIASNVKTIQADVLEITCIDLKNYYSSFNCVLSDMAPNTTGNKELDHYRCMELVRRVFEIADELLLNNGWVVCKVFQGEELADFIKEMKSSYKFFKTVKPKSSRSESKEIFLVGQK